LLVLRKGLNERRPNSKRCPIVTQVQDVIKGDGGVARGVVGQEGSGNSQTQIVIHHEGKELQNTEGRTSTTAGGKHQTQSKSLVNIGINREGLKLK
jgi:hypothetical protein